MEKLKPKLYIAVTLGLLYNLPRIYLNVHVFGSLCTLYHNVILGQFHARQLQQINSHPKQLYEDKLLPRYLLDYVNSLQQFDLTFELQHTSIALPFQHFSPKCYFHLDQMRDSLVFQLYFVLTDCLFLVVIIIVVIYSTVFFFLEIKKAHEFRASASSAGAKKANTFWTLPRVGFLINAIVVVGVLIAQIIFTIFWLVIDFDGVFLVQIIRYIELFYFYSIIFYLTALSATKLLQLNALAQCCG